MNDRLRPAPIPFVSALAALFGLFAFTLAAVFHDAPGLCAMWIVTGFAAIAGALLNAGPGQPEAAPRSAPAVQLTATAPATRCPFCHGDFEDAQVTAECADCGATHHLACYGELGGCAVGGCASSQVRARRVSKAWPTGAPAPRGAVYPGGTPDPSAAWPTRPPPNQRPHPC